MNEIDFYKLDFNLLKSLQALLEEGHVGRAAVRMHVTQSAMSHSLSRLRTTFNDPLFTRTHKGIEPTARALELSDRLSSVLFDIALLMEPQSFDPSSLNTQFRIQTHNFVAASYLPSALLAIQKTAPKVVFELQLLGTEAYQKLNAGKIDLVIGAGLKANPALMQRRLSEEPLVCLLSSDHPALKDWKVETIYEYPHVKLSLLDDRDDPISQYVKMHELPERKIGILTETLELQPAVVAGSTFIAFVPLSLAKTACRQFSLTIKRCPFEIPLLQINSLWHERNQKDKAHNWIRGEIANAFENNA